MATKSIRLHTVKLWTCMPVDVCTHNMCMHLYCYNYTCGLLTFLALIQPTIDACSIDSFCKEPICMIYSRHHAAFNFSSSVKCPQSEHIIFIDLHSKDIAMHNEQTPNKAYPRTCISSYVDTPANYSNLIEEI